MQIGLISRIVALLLVWAYPAHAGGDVRAVLVGVSDYLYLDADLKGPRNDVQLMRNALISRGIPDTAITVLSQDGIAPTRIAILGALDDLARDSKPGDQALFYFSGHGAQAPDKSGDEMGGLDEIFLPSDARGWSGSIGAVEGAILDDEFQLKAAAILAKGASLVVILDACHAATGFRALGGQGVARTLSSVVLNIPDDVLSTTAAAPAPPLVGDFVFLYAAQSDERAFEYPLGDADDPANWFGAFTRALTLTLQSVPDLTWAQAMQATVATMKQGSAAQTPDIEGTILNTAVVGTAIAPAPRIRFEGGKLQAGLLSGLTQGSAFILYDSATSTDEAGRARIDKVSARTAVLALTEGTVPAKGFALLTAPGMAPMVRISAPQDIGDGQAYDALIKALAAVQMDGVETNAMPYDIGLVLTDGRIALTGRDGVLDPNGPGTSPRTDAAGLAGALERAVRVHRLRAALASVASTGMSAMLLSTAGLSVKIAHREGAGASGSCQDAAQETPAKDGHAIAPCDQLWVHLKNTSATARDVTVLYVDSENHITPIWPVGAVSNRLGFGEETSVGLQIVAGDSLQGVEELIIIAVPAKAGAARTVLTALADPAPSRAVGSSPVAGFLLTAADPGASARSFKLRAPLDPVEVTRMSFHFQK